MIHPNSDPVETYRGFKIEPNSYGSARHRDQWQWSPAEADGTPYRFEATAEDCREAIDDELDWPGPDDAELQYTTEQHT